MNTELLFDVIRAPHVSEKGTRVADKHQQIIFKVRVDATKPVIKALTRRL